MPDSRLHSQVAQLCAQGFLLRKNLTVDESSLIELLDQLDISCTESDEILEIPAPLPLLDIDSIEAHIDQTLAIEPFAWQYRLITGSTNADASELFEARQQPCIVLAEKQTAGRGRRGRQWLSPFAKNIYCTIGVPKSIKGYNPGLLSIVTGIALCEALEKAGIDGVKLKWPNDLYYQNKKLGGVLIESRNCGADEYFFAIGFGINLTMDEQDFDNIPQAATSLNLISDSPVSRDRVLCETISQVISAIDSFDESRVCSIVEAFKAIDAFHNMPVTATTSEQSIQGTSAGIDSTGHLLLDTKNGQLQFSAADISLRGQT